MEDVAETHRKSPDRKARNVSEADKRQEGGSHYRTDFWQTWNLIIPMKWTAFQLEIINYVDRYKRKGGIEDLKKARHWLDKLIEAEEEALSGTRQLGEGFSISSVPSSGGRAEFADFEGTS